VSEPAGVRVGDLDPGSVDAAAVAHHGDPAREQRTLATAAGLVDRTHRDLLVIPGPDRITWLHDLTTQHLRALAPWQGTELLVLSPHGHVEAHAVATDDGSATWLDTEPGGGPGLLEFLTRMRFMTRVEPAGAGAGWGLWSLVGPAADTAVTRLGIAALDPPRTQPVPPAKFASADVAPVPTTLYQVAALPGGGWARRMGYGYDLLVPRDRTGLAAELGVPRAGHWAFEALRVAARVPRLGFETDHRTIPAEVGWLGAAVHLDKGCYRGQETVARVHNLGRPPRRLVLLHLDGIGTDELPAPGTPVLVAGGDRPVGVTGTAVRHFELGMVVLALVKRSVADSAELRVGPAAAAIDPD